MAVVNRSHVPSYCQLSGVRPSTAAQPCPSAHEIDDGPVIVRCDREHTESGQVWNEVGQVQSWDTERRVVYKAEALEKGMNIRFVVTARDDLPEVLCHWYTQRGNYPELCTEDLRENCFADRLSCHRFWADQFRSAARCRLLALGYDPAPISASPRPASPTRHPATPAPQDWGLGPPAPGGGLAPPGNKSSRHRPLAPLGISSQLPANIKG